MRSLFYWLLLISVLYPLPEAAAVEVEPNTTQEPTEAEQAAAEASAATSTKPAPESIFIPTEDISEDAAVSYPIDI